MNSHTVAQGEQPCARYVGKWHNKWDILVDLNIHDAGCKYSLKAQAANGVIRVAFGDPKHTEGRGYLSPEGLVLLLAMDNPKAGHFLLNRNHQDLSGTVTVPPTLFGSTFPITLQSVTEFPTRSATR